MSNARKRSRSPSPQRKGPSSSSSSSSSSFSSSCSGSGKENGSEFAHLFVYASEKAGMKTVDKALVNQVVYEMSKGSDYLKNAQRQDAKTQAKVKSMQAKLSTLQPSRLSIERERVDKHCSKLESRRNLDRIFAVVDMDMFYAAVEMRDNPTLIGKPIAVGGNAMISTANYEARQYGVRSAMPGFIAKKLCPHLVFVKHSFEKYKQASEQVKQVLREYDPNLSSMSLDEAYLDLTDYVERVFQQQFGSEEKQLTSLREKKFELAWDTVDQMRRRVSEKTRLTCSAGIAATRMIAKIASDFNKPNGQYMVAPNRQSMIDFVHKLPTRKIPGIGKVMEKMLFDTLNIKTVADLWEQRYYCSYLFSPRTTEWFLRVCLCCTSSRDSSEDSFSSASSSSRKSISIERTFRDKQDKDELMSTCRLLCQGLAGQCESKGIRGRCLTLKLKFASFEVKTRQVSFAQAVPRTATGEDLFEKAKELLERELPCKLRLMGVRLSHLDSNNTDGDENDSGNESKPSRIEHFFSLGSGSSKDDKGTSSDDSREQDEKADEGEDLQVDDGKEEELFKCPVCMGSFAFETNAEINAHVDLCLNKPILPEIESSPTAASLFSQSKARTPRKISSFFQLQHSKVHH